MATDAKVVMTNSVGGYIAEDKDIKGGWLTCASSEEMTGIKPVALKTGSLCFRVDEKKFYKWDGSAWIENSMTWECEDEEGNTFEIEVIKK